MIVKTSFNQKTNKIDKLIISLQLHEKNENINMKNYCKNRKKILIQF